MRTSLSITARRESHIGSFREAACHGNLWRRGALGIGKIVHGCLQRLQEAYPERIPVERLREKRRVYENLLDRPNRHYGSNWSAVERL